MHQNSDNNQAKYSYQNAYNNRHSNQLSTSPRNNPNYNHQIHSNNNYNNSNNYNNNNFNNSYQNNRPLNYHQTQRPSFSQSFVAHQNYAYSNSPRPFPPPPPPPPHSIHPSSSFSSYSSAQRFTQHQQTSFRPRFPSHNQPNPNNYNQNSYKHDTRHRPHNYRSDFDRNSRPGSPRSYRHRRPSRSPPRRRDKDTSDFHSRERNSYTKRENNEQKREPANSNKYTDEAKCLFKQNSAYVQTTLIPIYYKKDENNSKLVKATEKLLDLCMQFEDEILMRGRRAREKANIPLERLAVPDYRKLLLTKKFDNFSRCTCDKSHQNENESKADKCKKHAKSKMSRSVSDSDTSIASASNFSSSGSEDEANGKKKEAKQVEKEEQEQEKEQEEEESEFEDLKSMEIHRKQNHPERLHPDLSFNEPDQTNEGPLCKCKLKNTTFGTRHQIYYGEKAINKCDSLANNSTRLYHYRMSIEPFTNFVFKTPTCIEYDNHKYNFEGYSIFTHEPIESNLPDCVVVIFNQEYKLNIVKEDMLENFTVKELELLREFIFVEILELYDLKWRGYDVNQDTSSTSCDRFHVLPRFCRPLPYDGKELLSPCEILKYFLANNVPVIGGDALKRCHLFSNREWLNFVEPLQGSIVTCPGKRPASLRLDQLDRDHLKARQNELNAEHPLIIHFSMYRNTWLPMIKNNLKLKKLYHKYFKLRHLLNNKSKLSDDDRTKLRVLGEELQELIAQSSQTHKETMIELNSEQFRRTGIRTDLVQQTLLVPTFVEHLRFHFSLKYLEEKIEYKFKNRLLLQHALTHPSGAFLLHQNLGSNPDHIRNCLFNCKVRTPQYGILTPNKRKSMLRKKGIHMLFQIMSQKGEENEEESQLSNYERLEFLGDKILELLISKHLFFLFENFDEGQLSEYRNAIVQNQYLAILARKLDLHYFIIFYHGVDLCSNSALNHALANSFEALLAAIYLDSNLETVEKMLSKILWNANDAERDLYEIWTDLRPHPIQSQLPDGDRHLISTIKILQHVSLFEEMIGVEFKHIRLLAQAFCTRSASFNLITLGDNQRMEFLGDTVLNFVCSDYLYRHFPNHHEGHLSLLRSSLVCNSTQALLYDELGMDDFVLTAYINSKKKESCANSGGNLKRKADVFEAFVGALYIDYGLEAVGVFCNVCMFNKLKDIILYQFWHDPKSRLQQCCLSLRDVDDSKPSLPKYKLIEERGPPNNKQYRVAVYFNRKRIGEGVGKSIHDGEVEAAKNALKSHAQMFPILNKYITNELRNSIYCPESLKTSQSNEDTASNLKSTSTDKKKKQRKKAKKEKQY